MPTGTIFDLIVIAALIVSAVIAFLRGFIREVLTILGVVGGLVCAYFMGPLIAPAVRGWLGVDPESTEEEPKFLKVIPYDVAADAIAYGTIFIVIVLLLSVLSHLLSNAAKAVGLGPVDRTFGVMFGIIRGLVLLALLYLPVFLLVEKEIRDSWFEGSRTVVYVDGMASMASEMIPESFTADMEKKITEQAETTREKLQEIEVLQDDSGAPKAEGGVDAVTETTEEDPSGYDPGERLDINRLIEDTGPEQ